MNAEHFDHSVHRRHCFHRHAVPPRWQYRYLVSLSVSAPFGRCRVANVGVGIISTVVIIVEAVVGVFSHFLRPAAAAAGG